MMMRGSDDDGEDDGGSNDDGEDLSAPHHSDIPCFTGIFIIRADVEW